MARRFSKQLIIALIFISILFSFSFLIYYFDQPAPSCFDGIQNQGEEGVDCGGPCLLSCERREVKRIEVLWTEAMPGQDNFYDLAAQIKNPNQNYGSGQIPYHFELYDSKDNLITQCSGSTFILPNQTKYLVRIRIGVNEMSEVSKTELSFGEIKWQKIEDYQPPQLFVQQKEYRLLGSEEPGFSQARGILTNKTNFDFDKIDIDVLLFNSSHHLLALNTTEIRSLLAGQERDFVATWFKKIDGQVVFVEAEPETNIFDPSNYLLPEKRDLERFQEY